MRLPPISPPIHFHNSVLMHHPQYPRSSVHQQKLAPNWQWHRSGGAPGSDSPGKAQRQHLFWNGRSSSGTSHYTQCKTSLAAKPEPQEGRRKGAEKLSHLSGRAQFGWLFLQIPFWWAPYWWLSGTEGLHWNSLLQYALLSSLEAASFCCSDLKLYV